MGAKIQAFDIFQTPLSSHYPLPLRPKNTYIDQEADRCGKDSLPLVLGSTALPRPNIALKFNS